MYVYDYLEREWYGPMPTARCIAYISDRCKKDRRAGGFRVVCEEIAEHEQAQRKERVHVQV